MKYSQADEEIYGIIRSYVNRVDSHNIDKDLLHKEITNIVGQIEDIALDIEDGVYEIPQSLGDA